MSSFVCSPRSPCFADSLFPVAPSRFNLPTRTFARLREVLKEVYNELPSDFVVKYADEVQIHRLKAF